MENVTSPVDNVDIVDVEMEEEPPNEDKEEVEGAKDNTGNKEPSPNGDRQCLSNGRSQSHTAQMRASPAVSSISKAQGASWAGTAPSKGHDSQGNLESAGGKHKPEQCKHCDTVGESNNCSLSYPQPD